MNNASPNLTPVRGPDQTVLSRYLVMTVLFLITVTAALWTLKTGSMLYMSLLILLPFVLMLSTHPETALVLAMVLDATELSLPGISSYATMGILAKMMLIVIFVMSSLQGSKLWIGGRLPEKRPLLLFVADIILLMVVRGTGIRVLGSSTWGGFIYLILIFSVFFFISLNGLLISRKNIHRIVWGSLVAGGIGALLGYAGWKPELGLVVEGASGSSTAIGQSRLMWLSSLIAALFPLAFALKVKHHAWVSSLLLVAVFLLTGLTGFRTRMIVFIITVVGYGFFKARTAKGLYVLKLILIGAIAWIGIAIANPQLPLALQRSLTVVPGIRADEAVRKNAEGTVDWRIDIWKYCLDQAPEYLLVGRGSAFGVAETVGELGVDDISSHSPWLAFLTRSYHSGPLQLLVDYGLLGLLSMLWLTVLLIARLWKLARRLAGLDTFESRYALFLCVFLMWQWISFYLIFGAMPLLATLIMGTAVAMVVGNSALAIAERETLEAQAVEEANDTPPVEQNRMDD